jgi:hypothetical protein
MPVPHQDQDLHATREPSCSPIGAAQLDVGHIDAHRPDERHVST